MSKLTDWLSKAGAELTAVEHAAMHLIAVVANGQANLQELETDHPLIAEAIAAGTAAATAHGIPVLTIEQTVIAIAKEMTAMMGAAPEPAPVQQPSQIVTGMSGGGSDASVLLMNAAAEPAIPGA